jgi:hypothetical protein
VFTAIAGRVRAKMEMKAMRKRLKIIIRIGRRALDAVGRSRESSSGETMQ